MNDGRQMVGQMLAFDKVCATLGCWQLTNAYSSTAHEPRPRRYRRVQTRQAQGDKGISSSRRKQQLSTTRRVGREAYIRSDNCSRRSYYLPLSRVSTARGPICTVGSKCARGRSCFVSRCRCGNCTPCWTRSTCWIGGMSMFSTYFWIFC